MTKTSRGAGEVQSSTGAQVVSTRPERVTATSVAAISTPRTTQAVYDPNADARRCSTCGRRDGWRRWTWANPGGWFCCAPAEPTTHHGNLSHLCSIVCAAGGAA